MALLTATLIGLAMTVVGLQAGKVLGQALALTIWGSDDEE